MSGTENTEGTQGEQRRSVASSAAFVAIGAVFGQGLAVLASPVVTRLYDPATFGVLVAYMSGLGVLAVASSGRYQLAIQLPEDERDARAVAWAGIVTVALYTSVVAAGLLLVPRSWLTPIGLGPLDGFRAWLAAGVAMVGITLVLTGWATRKDRFKSIGLARASDGATRVGLQIGLGVAGLGAAGLLLADLIGRLVGALILAPAMLDRAPPAVQRIRQQAREHWRFPLVSTPGGLLNAGALHAPALLMAATYGPAAAGLYGLAVRVVGVPTTVVGQAVAQAYLGTLGQTVREEPDRLVPLFRQTTLRIGALGLVPFGLLAWLGPAGFAWIFGEDWTDTGHFVRLLALAFWLQFTTAPTSTTLTMLGRQTLQLTWDAARLVAVVGVLLTAYRSGAELQTTVAWLGAVMSAAYVVLLGGGAWAARIGPVPR